MDPPPPLVVLREVLAPQVVGVGEGQPRQAAEDEDVADAGQPVVELLAGQQFQAGAGAYAVGVAGTGVAGFTFRVGFFGAGAYVCPAAW